jgi:hypothetical protein
VRLAALLFLGASCTPATLSATSQEAHAALTLTMGVEQVVALLTTVQRVEGVDGANWLELFDECDPTYVYIVTDPSAVNGETALPSTGRARYPKALFPGAVYIAGGGKIGLAGSSAGNCRVRFRYIP